MCPVYNCNRCRDTGLMRQWLGPVQYRVICCTATGCRAARIQKLREDIKARELPPKKRTRQREKS